MLFQRFDCFRRDDVKRVNLSAAELQRHRIQIGYDLEDDAVHIWQPAIAAIDLPEEWVPLKDQALIRGERNNPVRAQADHVLRVGRGRKRSYEVYWLVNAIPFVLGNQIDASDRDQKFGVWLQQVKPYGIVAILFIFWQGPIRLNKQDARWRCCPRIENKAKVEDDVICCKGMPIRPAYSRRRLNVQSNPSGDDSQDFA